MERMAIVGLGLIGGSLGLALKAAKLTNVEIVGYDTDTIAAVDARRRGAGELLPPSVSFVGGHPMAGKETAGIANADAKLFAGKSYCIVPSPNATEGAARLVGGPVHLIGAQPLFIDAQE